MDADDVRALARDVPSRWRWLHLVHTDGEEVEAWLRHGEVEGRPTVAFRAVARKGYDPICSCCPLVLSDVAWRLEHQDRPVPPDLPVAADLALDLETGIVVSREPVGGGVTSTGFRTRILDAS